MPPKTTKFLGPEAVDGTGASLRSGCRSDAIAEASFKEAIQRQDSGANVSFERILASPFLCNTGGHPQSDSVDDQAACEEGFGDLWRSRTSKSGNAMPAAVMGQPA